MYEASAKGRLRSPQDKLKVLDLDLVKNKLAAKSGDILLPSE